MTLPNKPAVERRQFYRLIYPPEFAPEVFIMGTTFRVMDISKREFASERFFTRLDTGQGVQGVVIFKDLSKFEFKGMSCGRKSRSSRSFLLKIFHIKKYG